LKFLGEQVQLSRCGKNKYLERKKIIIRDDNDGGFQIPIPDEDIQSKLQVTSVTYRFATGKSKGRKAIVLKSVSDNDHDLLPHLGEFCRISPSRDSDFRQIDARILATREQYGICSF